MSLAQDLDRLKDAFAQKNDPAVVAAYEKGIEELRAAGLERDALKRGDPAPDFTLPDAVGRAVSLSGRLKDGPVVLKFYRGGWCPYCNLELRAWQKALPQLGEAGGQLMAVSPESPDNSLSTLENNALAFTVLTDRGGSVARTYRLAFHLSPELKALYQSRGRDLGEWNGGDWTLPLPGTFVIGRDGRIALAHVDADYRARLEPTEAIAALRAAS